ncbi:MAG: hypothetical protein AB1696_03590 [Planctomycetota bacterium]
MQSHVHRPLRIKLDLQVQELERRVAPAVVLTNGMSFQYNAFDGDLDEVTFYGPGSVTLANSTGADPGTPGDENLWYVDLVGTTGKSRLYIRDVIAGDGSDNLIVNNIRNFGGGAMGVIDLSSSGIGQVRFAGINLTCPLQSLNIHGPFYNGGVTTTSSVRSIAIDNYAEICGFAIGGDLGTFSTGGGMLQGYLDVAGHLGSARITGGDVVGTRVNIGSGCDRFDIYGNTWSNAFVSAPAEFNFYSGVQSFSVYGDMVGTLFQSLNGNVGRLYVQGTVQNSPVGGLGPIATSIALNRGTCGRIYIGGDLLLDNSGGPSSTTLTLTGMRAGTIEIAGSVRGGADVTPINGGGSCGRLAIGGDLLGDLPNTDTASIITTNGSMGTLLIGGNSDYAQIVSQFSNQSLIAVNGAINDTVFNLMTGNTAAFRVSGDVTNTTLTAVSQTFSRLWFGGNVSNSAFNILLGSCGQTIIGGSIDTVVWTVGGPHASFRTGDFTNAFTYNAAGPVGSFYVGGPATNSNFTFTGGCDLLMIRGDASGSNVAWNAPMERMLILGDANAVALAGAGGLDFFRVMGHATALTAAVAGETGMFLIAGVLDVSVLNMDGMTNLFRVGGAVMNTGLTFTEHVGQMLLGGISNSQINITNTFPAPGPASGGVGRIVIQNDVDAASTIVVFGPCGSALIGGDVWNSTFTFNNGLGRFSVSGRMENSNLNVLGGGVDMPPATAIHIADGVWGASALLVDGDCSHLYIGRGLNDTSTVDIRVVASSVVIGGDMGQNTIVTIGEAAVNGWGFTYYTGTLQRMLVRGLIFGNIDVYGTLHAIDSAGAAAIPNGGSGAPFTGGFQPTNAFGVPIVGAQVDYVTLAPGGYVS